MFLQIRNASSLETTWMNIYIYKLLLLLLLSICFAMQSTTHSTAHQSSMHSEILFFSSSLFLHTSIIIAMLVMEKATCLIGFSWETMVLTVCDRSYGNLLAILALLHYALKWAMQPHCLIANDKAMIIIIILGSDSDSDVRMLHIVLDYYILTLYHCGCEWHLDLIWRLQLNPISFEISIYMIGIYMKCKH